MELDPLDPDHAKDMVELRLGGQPNRTQPYVLTRSDRGTLLIGGLEENRRRVHPNHSQGWCGRASDREPVRDATREEHSASNSQSIMGRTKLEKRSERDTSAES